MRNKRRAFTLSEVLLVLSVIGVVAALTIPTLIQKSQEQEYNSSLKKIYSDLLQATTHVQYLGVDFPATTDAEGVRNSFGTVFKYIRTDTAVNIWGDVDSSSTYKNYKGTAPAYIHMINNGPAAILANGMFIGFYSGYRITRDHHEIYLDTNGRKGPNMFGFDLHKFFLEFKDGQYKLLAAGMPGAYFGGTCTVGSVDWTTSWPCTTLRLSSPEKMP